MTMLLPGHVKMKKETYRYCFGILPIHFPDDSVNNQDYYIRDLPAKSKGKVKINISKIPDGTYKVEIYKVGYRVNDPYTTYFDMGRPNQLTKEQVQKIKKLNDGSAISSKIIEVKNGSTFSKRTGNS